MWDALICVHIIQNVSLRCDFKPVNSFSSTVSPRFSSMTHFKDWGEIRCLHILKISINYSRNTWQTPPEPNEQNQQPQSSWGMGITYHQIQYVKQDTPTLWCSALKYTPCSVNENMSDKLKLRDNNKIPAPCSSEMSRSWKTKKEQGQDKVRRVD